MSNTQTVIVKDNKMLSVNLFFFFSPGQVEDKRLLNSTKIHIFVFSLSLILALRE